MDPYWRTLQIRTVHLLNWSSVWNQHQQQMPCRYDNSKPFVVNKMSKWVSSLNRKKEFFSVGDSIHDDVIKWKHFPRYWPFVRGIHRSPVDSPHKGQWRRALMFSLIWINGWVNNRGAGDLRRHRAYYDVIVMNSCRLYVSCPGNFVLP